MKIIKYLLLHSVLIFTITNVQAQLEPGNFNVTGDWNVTIPALQEAGLDYPPIESASNESTISWRLDSGLGIQTIPRLLLPDITFDPDLSLCAGNVQNYGVFVHKVRPLALNAANDFKIFARRTSGGFDPSENNFGPGGLISGIVFGLIRVLLGIPSLPDYVTKTSPIGGNSYTEIKEGSATEFFRFQGCRDDISVQYQLELSVITPVDSYNTEIIYTIADESILSSLGL